MSYRYNLFWTRFIFLFVFCMVLQSYHCINSLDKTFKVRRDSEKPKQFVINYDREVLIVRGKSEMYELDDELNKITPTSVSVADHPNDPNYLMFILPDSDRLITCQYYGDCGIRSSVNISNSTDTTFKTDCFNRNTGETFVGIVTDVKIDATSTQEVPIFGAANCGANKDVFISAKQKNFGNVGKYYFRFKQRLSNYPVYFRAVLSYSKFLFFLTNQKLSTGSTLFTSKIIKICKDSENSAKSRVTYEDIPISCSSKTGTTEYKLLQHASLLQVSENDELAGMCRNRSDCALIIGIFSSGNDPENTELLSAVCVFTVDKILTYFKESRERNMIIPITRFDGGYMNFIGDIGETAYKLTNQTFKERGFDALEFCSTSTPVNLMSNVTLSSTAVFEQQGTRFTKIESLMTNGLAHVYIGTSDGKLMELYVQSEKAEIIGNVMTVENGKAVSEMGQLNRGIYAMTENKVVKVGTVNCEMYNDSCEKCVNTWIPACGWCILTQKCTEKMKCPDGNVENYWLPAARQKCIKLDLDKIGIRIGLESTVVTVKTDPPISALNGVSFSCKYASLKTKSRGLVGGKCSGIAPQQVHGEYPLYLLARKGSGPEVVVAEIMFWSYDCTKFETCGNCLQNRAKFITCFWCKETAACASNSGDCANRNLTSIVDTANCSAVSDSEMLRIPFNISEDMTFPGKNIPYLPPVATGHFQCRLHGERFSVSAVTGNSITCRNVFAQRMSSPKTSNETLEIYFRNRLLDSTEIEVYNCKNLALDCSSCNYYKRQNYSCNWCDNCQHKTKCGTSQTCPAPVIKSMTPLNSTLGGGTMITFSGTDFGVSENDITNITLAGIPCENIDKKDTRQMVWCITGKSDMEKDDGLVVMTVSGQETTNGTFSYKDPHLKEIKPNVIIKEGGVLLTISGRNLHVGNKNFQVMLNDTDMGEPKIINCANTSLTKEDSIECLIDKYPCNNDATCKTQRANVDKLKVTFDGQTVKELPINFTYVGNPSGLRLTPNRSFASGGRNLTVRGNGLNYVIKASFDRKPCTKDKGIFKCPAPRKNETNTRRKRSIVEERRVKLHLDGFEQEFTITYVPDPKIHEFENDREYDPENPVHLNITGENMNAAAVREDYIVTVGATICTVVELNSTYLLCLPREKKPGSGDRFPVKVRVGNLAKQVGHLKYVEVLNFMIIVISCVLSGVIVVIIIVGVVLYRQLKTKKKQAVEKIWLVVRENEEKQAKTMQQEFATMQTTIKDIKQDIVTTGMPFFSFEHYAFNQLFPKEDYDNHILMKQIPVPNENRSAVEKAMSDLEKLIFNKFFIKSVIFTLDKERKFTMQDKAQFASMLSVLFVSRMDHFLEVVKLLLSSLIENTQKRQQKTLFRRAESISTRLLSDWLSLAIYSYLKDEGSGAHLFMLYKATQTLMEKCPIDAVTGEAEVTLSQEKLLKDTIETETLELSVELGESEKKYDCKVLDCDTIHQAKAKCLYSIYKNKPASEIPQADDVELEWHAGMSGKLILLDISATNEKEDGYLRINTLKDYCVKSGSNMALVGKYEDDEIYMNTKSHVNGGFVADEHEVKIEMNPDDIQWHLVKPQPEDEKAHKPKILDEVYNTRLLRTKLSLKEYIDDIFNNLMDADKLDPVVKYLFSLMDKYGTDNDVESETIQIWKSDIYANRIWATLITRPEVLFDIQKASHVEPSLDVIKQALIDSFSMVPHKLGKSSPTQKLLFAAEVKSCQEKVHTMYKTLANEPKDSISEVEMRQLMTKFSSQHGQIGFNKYSVLYQLFLYIKTYIDDILSDLDEDTDTRELELGGKLDSVIEQMDLEGVGNMNGHTQTLYTRYT